MVRLLALIFALAFPALAHAAPASYAPVVKRVVPAVVNIYTKHVEKVQTPLSSFANDPFFQQFFAQQGMLNLPRERVVNSLGSGVIVGENGVIVTSYHVVKGSDKIIVVLSDKREFTGVVEKLDERYDLAILKVDTAGASLPTVELRDSDTLEVGDLVLAVGNPFGVGQTVTSGIISALARSAAGLSDAKFFIQTDAAINPGNSGGALVDMDGKLIGINTAIYSQTGGYQGIGFAIPANMVKSFQKQQAGKTGQVLRPWFGVVVQPVTREIAESQGMATPRGALVSSVTAKSPAAEAGIKPGDIILAVGNTDISDAQTLGFRIDTTGIGSETDIKLWRGGKEVTLPVTFAETPELADKAGAVTLKGNHPLSGVTVITLTPDMGEAYGFKIDKERVLVLKGNGMNIDKGDLILGVNGKETRTVTELQNALAVPTSRFQITFLRGNMTFNMTMQR